MESQIRVKVFDDVHTPKIRNFTKSDMEEDSLLADAFKSPVRQFWGDTPLYPWRVREPLVHQPYGNFNLNYTE
uniref:Uncharacterized protein n=1 Tax=Torque teno mini virus 10 TaxID=2065036 RepID=A0A3S8RKD5_9VIRU|nr:hypothetical protein ORF4 [Torque teno mini virus 10]AZK35851.1 hypothetical protein ORF4 [Torque teno mini virus 10]